ncbi:MAG: DoxX family membrane protein [Planctomycetes bacterium]|nr:DoxX family membrane protein [Planctomycetota bacterium]
MTSQTLTSNVPAPATRAWLPLLRTRNELAPVALRVTLALVMLPHGAQKALGLFGGYGWTGTMGFLTDSVGLPSAMAAGIILFELIGPLLLLLGLGTRLVGLGLVGLMLGAVFTVHAQHGFFMNWSGSQAGEGFEYHLLMIGGALALALAGAGRWSLDRWLVQRHQA